MSGIARGERVGRYELVQLLGEGGMGTVWLAHPHDAPDQLFAIKTVSPQYASDARVCTMFVKEASLAASIDHPNVVRLFDVGLHEDVPFFVMEWIDGFSLRQVARTVADTGRRVPAGIALRIAADLCGGLHAAHELRGDDGQRIGLVHRDVSPHNVLVTLDGIAKLIDFGVAKARDLATGNEQSVCGGLKGKVRYMAPEQALEKEIDRRADLFSVGAIVYQLLTGRAPFEGPNELAIINSLLATTPVYVPDTLPEPVQWILRRALSRRPEQRFADAAEMQNAIELALVELSEADTHADVAECLAWFDPRSEDEEVTSERRLQMMSQSGGLTPEILNDAGMRSPTPSQGSPSLAFAMPAPESIPARQSELPPDEDDLPRRRPPPPESPWRFVLLGAGFVGMLGIGAAMLVKDAPAAPRKSSVREASAAQLDNASLPSPASPGPNGASTTMPIIDFGDLDDGKPTTSRKPRRRLSSGATTSPPATSPATSPPPKQGGGGGEKTGDLAGNIKVWK